MSKHPHDSNHTPASGRQGDGDPGAGQPAGTTKERSATRPGEQQAPHEAMKRDRLDTIELADDLTEQWNPQRGGADDDTDSVGEMLEGRESNAEYRHEADRVTPTIGPDEESNTR